MEILGLPLIIFARLAFPLLILKFPLLGFLWAINLDIADWQFYNVENEQQFAIYQAVDKILDAYFMTFAAIVALRWKDKVSRNIALVAYFYRLVGILIFLIIQKDFVFLLFPNFFETFFIFYLLFRLFEKKEDLFNTKKSYFVILPLLFVPKLFQEFTHIAGGFPHKSFVMAFAYATLPGLALLWRLSKKLK